MAHTPGPWTLCGDGECTCMTIASKDHPIATVTRGEWGDDYPSIRLVGTSLDRKAEAYMERIAYGVVDDDTAIANARLLTAAPVLLDALEAVLFAGWCGESSPITDQVRAAIAAARGGRHEQR